MDTFGITLNLYSRCEFMRVRGPFALPDCRHERKLSWNRIGRQGRGQWQDQGGLGRISRMKSLCRLIGRWEQSAHFSWVLKSPAAILEGCLSVLVRKLAVETNCGFEIRGIDLLGHLASGNFSFAGVIWRFFMTSGMVCPAAVHCAHHICCAGVLNSVFLLVDVRREAPLVRDSTGPVSCNALKSPFCVNYCHMST